VPASVIWGDLDRSGWESGPPLAAALDAPEVVLPGVGHMPMLEAPYAFSVAIAEFLSATVPA
jgi:pimeloyl-ACP methyl ester carboxylesterase